MLRAAVVLFLVILLWGCLQEPRKVAPNPPPREAPEEGAPEEPNSEFKDLHYVIYEEGRMKWEIWAREARIYRGERIAMERLRVCSDPKKGFCISAQRASYRPREGTFLFEGQVVLKAPGQGVLRTSRLAYLPRKEVLETEARVEIDKQGLVVRGRGFVYDLRTGVMKVLHQTEVKVDG